MTLANDANVRITLYEFTQEEEMKFNKLIPELSVSDIERSREFYRNILGFSIEYERPEDGFAFLSLGEAQLMIEQLNDHWSVGEMHYPFGNGVNFQIEIEGLDAFVERVKAAGVVPFKDVFESRYRADDVVYVEKEVLFLDPDGYMLRFSETIEGE